jgi:hypothetical protein
VLRSSFLHEIEIGEVSGGDCRAIDSVLVETRGVQNMRTHSDRKEEQEEV